MAPSNCNFTHALRARYGVHVRSVWQAMLGYKGPPEKPQTLPTDSTIFSQIRIISSLKFIFRRLGAMAPGVRGGCLHVFIFISIKYLLSWLNY